MLKKYPKFCLFFALLIATLAWLQVAIESTLIAEYVEICDKTNGAKTTNCATYHIVIATLWKFIAVLNNYHGAITAVATVFIGWFTFTLYTATDSLVKASQRQEKAMRNSLRISERASEAARDSADASIKSAMPVLFPYITNMAKLHPLNVIGESITHPANIFITFDNYGKTPGIIREVRAELFLTEMDILPEVVFEDLQIHTYPAMIPGDARGADAKTGAIDLKQNITLSPSELNELCSEAVGKFRRFFLIGQVIYDDFFGSRHTSRFCIKLRMWSPQNGFINQFQIAFGGSKYNRVSINKIPKNDPFV